MSKFMSKNSDNFLSLALLNQGIINNNVLLPWQPKEIRITMRRSLATINNIKFV